MICHYCQNPTDDPRWVMGEPCCPDCRESHRRTIA